MIAKNLDQRIEDLLSETHGQTEERGKYGWEQVWKFCPQCRNSFVGKKLCPDVFCCEKCRRDFLRLDVGVIKPKPAAAKGRYAYRRW